MWCQTTRHRLLLQPVAIRKPSKCSVTSRTRPSCLWKSRTDIPSSMTQRHSLAWSGYLAAYTFQSWRPARRDCRGKRGNDGTTGSTHVHSSGGRLAPHRGTRGPNEIPGRAWNDAGGNPAQVSKKPVVPAVRRDQDGCCYVGIRPRPGCVARAQRGHRGRSCCRRSAGSVQAPVPRTARCGVR